LHPALQTRSLNRLRRVYEATYELDQKQYLRVRAWTEDGTALLEQAAGQGHAYAMFQLGCIHDARNGHEQAVKWYAKGAEAGSQLFLGAKQVLTGWSLL